MRTRPVVAVLDPAEMLRPGVMRTGMMRTRRPMVRRRRRRVVMGSGFGLRRSENRGSGSGTEYGGKTEQERTAAETRGFGTLHKGPPVVRRSFSVIGFPMDLTLLYSHF